jgi:FixJ family two-component response regulator
MIDAVMTAIERDRQRRVADAEVSQTQQRFEALSSWEQQVVLMVTAGKMNELVVSDLGISAITVKSCRGVAMRKMGVRTLGDLVRMAELNKPRRS